MLVHSTFIGRRTYRLRRILVFLSLNNLLKKIGLLMPFFIKIDDLEFCLRIKFAGAIVAFPSIAVWHEPFYAKVPIGTLIIVIAIF